LEGNGKAWLDADWFSGMTGVIPILTSLPVKTPGPLAEAARLTVST
jgi:hypothetical protein